MNVKPLADRVLVLPAPAEEKTIGGIIIPDTAKEKPQEGVVVAVSEGKYVDGKKVALDVKVDDKVIFSKYAGTDVKVDGTDYLIVRDSDILAVIE